MECMALSAHGLRAAAEAHTANLRTKILDFRGFDSSRILTFKGAIPTSRGNFPEIMGQQI